MSPGACRALVAVLTTLVAAVGMAVPVMAEEPRLNERSNVRYRVDPASGQIDVRIILVLENNGNQPYPAGAWGPIYLEDRAERVQGFEQAGDFIDVPGPWKAMRAATPRIEPGESTRVIVNYRVDAAVTNTDAQLDGVPARIIIYVRRQARAAGDQLH